MKKLIKIIVSIVGGVVLLGTIAFFGVYGWLRISYGIDLFATFQQLRVLGEEVNEEELCPNAFDENDMPDVQTLVNEHAEDLIKYSVENGTYTVDFDNLPAELNGIITLTDKQIGALLDTLVRQEYNNQIKVGDETLGLYVKQVIIDMKNEVPLLTTTVCLNLEEIKEDMNGFPLNLVKGYIPNNLYISSSVLINRPGNEAFAYSVTSDSLIINNLSSSDTKSLYNTANTFLKFGDLDDFNVQIGQTLADALIGSETATGLAYSLKSVGASDYSFSKGSYSVVH